MLIINDQCPVVIVFRQLPGGLFGGDVATFRNRGRRWRARRWPARAVMLARSTWRDDAMPSAIGRLTVGSVALSRLAVDNS